MVDIFIFAVYNLGEGMVPQSKVEKTFGFIEHLQIDLHFRMLDICA